MRSRGNRIVPAVLLSLISSLTLVQAEDKPFHDAPASAKAQKNPYAGQQAAADAGKALYTRNCLACHGKTLQGTGNVPSLVDGKLTGVSAGEIFWFVTKGDKDNGMPSWAFLPEEKRWQIVTYVESALSTTGKPAAGPTSAPAPEVAGMKIKAASPNAPFTDFRYEKPGTTRKITAKDLPKPYATDQRTTALNSWRVRRMSGLWLHLGSRSNSSRRVWRIRDCCGPLPMATSSWRRAILGGFACSAA
jgi:mono/diheme cytochrome c family protein